MPISPYRLQIMSTGLGLEAIQSGLEGRRLNETFFMTRPLGYDLTWNNVKLDLNSINPCIKTETRLFYTDPH